MEGHRDTEPEGTDVMVLLYGLGGSPVATGEDAAIRIPSVRQARPAVSGVYAPAMSGGCIVAQRADAAHRHGIVWTRRRVLQRSSAAAAALALAACGDRPLQPAKERTQPVKLTYAFYAVASEAEVWKQQGGVPPGGRAGAAAPMGGSQVELGWLA